MYKAEWCASGGGGGGGGREEGQGGLFLGITHIQGPFIDKAKICVNTVEPLLSDPLEGVTVRSDNKWAKRTDLNGESVFEVGQLKIWIIKGRIIEVLLYMLMDQCEWAIFYREKSTTEKNMLMVWM